MNRKNPHYAWTIAIMCSVLYFVCNGLATGCFSTFLPYIKEAYGFSNTQVSSIITVRSLISLLCNFFVLTVIQRFGIRKTATLACCLSGIAYLVYSRANTIPAFYIGTAFAGVCYGLVSSVTTSILLHRWFRDRMDIALSICASGAGVAAFLVPSIAAFLILHTGLQLSFLVASAACFAAGIFVCYFLVDQPADRGLAPYQTGKNSAVISDKNLADGRAGVLPKMKALYLVPLLLGAISLNCQALHMMYYSERGYEGTQAAFALSLYGLMLLFGKLGYGFISDLWGHQPTSLFFLLLILIGVSMCCFISKDPAVMYLASALTGAGVSTASVGIPIWVGDFSSPDAYEREAKQFQLYFAAGGPDLLNLARHCGRCNGKLSYGVFYLYFLLCHYNRYDHNGLPKTKVSFPIQAFITKTLPQQPRGMI